MTDKQVIIDGCDVSRCIYFKMNDKMPMCRACNSGVGSPYCEYNKACYYKQLKAKEQECEELRRCLLQVQNASISLNKKLDQFEQTLAEIKEIVKNMNNECFYSDFDCEDCDMKNGCTYFNKKQILQKISECKVE